MDLRPNKKKVIIFFILIFLASFIDSRVRLQETLEPLNFLKALFYPFYFSQTLSVEAHDFMFGTFGIIFIPLLLLVSVLIFYIVSCYVYDKEKVVKNYRFLIFIIIFLLFISLNTINWGGLDAPSVYGFPIIFYQGSCGFCIQPCSECHIGFRVVEFISNIIIWAAAYFLVIFAYKNYISK